MLSQWFLSDVVRRTTEAARCIFDYCLSPSCSTTSSKRARSLSRIVESTAALASLVTGFESALGNLIYRLLLHMLREGPKTGWELVDSTLRQIFEGPPDTLPLGQNIVTAFDILRTESWGDSGKELRVSVKTTPQLIY
jgi:serine/threonine-protein kinase ATR